METECLAVSKTNHLQLCQAIGEASDVLFVFPLYADAIPVTLLDFFKTLETHQGANRPTVSVLINCGFLEPEQNDIAVQMVRLFAEGNGYPFGSVLKVGSGEAILSTPFQIFVRIKVKKLAASIERKKYCTMQVTMPLSKRMFIKASTNYWKNYGRRNGLTKEQMETMKIEE